MFDFGLPADQPLDLTVIGAAVLGTHIAAVLSLILVMPPLRMSLYSIQVGVGKVLLVSPGRRVTVQWRLEPWTLGVLGVYRDVRSLAVRKWLFRFSQLVAVLGWGLLAGSLCASGGRFQHDILAGTLLSACFLLASRTRDKRSYIAGLLKPRLKSDPQTLADTLAVQYAEIRFGQGDDRPMRALAVEQGPDSMPAARVAYMEGRFVDALAIVDRLVSLLAAGNPAAAEKIRATHAGHLAELALCAAEARQIPVAEAIPRAKAVMAGQPFPDAIQALAAVLSGDPHTALPPARKARRQPGSRLDLADIHCTLAHIHGVLGDRAAANESLVRARALAPSYARPDHVARRLDSADPQVVAAG